MNAYFLFRHRTHGHFVAARRLPAASAQSGLELLFNGQPLPAVICSAFIRESGGHVVS